MDPSERGIEEVMEFVGDGTGANGGGKGMFCLRMTVSILLFTIL